MSELNDMCPHGDKYVSDYPCLKCGAPVCCQLCCAKDENERLRAENEKLKELVFRFADPTGEDADTQALIMRCVTDIYDQDTSGTSGE